MFKLRTAMAICIAIALLSTTPAPAGAEPQITQNAKLRQIKYFSGSYARANPAADNPTYQLTASTRLTRATGKIRGKIATYKLTEQSRKWDFYFVDVDYQVYDRKGDEDWGWMKTWVSNVGKVRTYHPAYSKGIGAVNKDDCRSYDIGLSAGFMGIGAGTKIATFKTCAKGASISSSAFKRGRSYQVNRLNGVYQVNMRRFVQVKAGQKPKFQVETSWNYDSGRTHCGHYPSAGSTTVYDCWPDRGSRGGRWTIGTQR